MCSILAQLHLLDREYPFLYEIQHIHQGIPAYNIKEVHN